SDGGTSTPSATATVEATAAPSPTGEPEPTPQPTLEELYRPVAHADMGAFQRVTPSRIPPPSIEAANAEAGLWLRDYEPPDTLPAAFEGVAGSVEPQCVEVTEYSRIRSGGFALDLAYMGRGRPVLGLLAADVAGVQEGYSNPRVVRRS